MRAETGVGPSIASGSQADSGNCADLPAHPPNRQSPISVNVSLESVDTARGNEENSESPTWKNSSKMPVKNAASPILFKIMAFGAAQEARGLCLQNPIKR